MITSKLRVYRSDHTRQEYVMSKQQIGVVGMAVMGVTLRSTSKVVVILSLFSTDP
ncbi:Uncharacterised protein [Klebsiella pneumoniae]|nr:Uncharacterised protein [Klebsiella pneumoniae]